MTSRAAPLPFSSMWDSLKYFLGCDTQYQQELNNFLSEVPSQLQRFTADLKTWKSQEGSLRMRCDGYLKLYDLEQSLAARNWSIVSWQEERVLQYNFVLRTVFRVVAPIFKWYTGISKLEEQYRVLAPQFAERSTELKIEWMSFQERMNARLYPSVGFTVHTVGKHDKGSTVIVARGPFNSPHDFSGQMVLTQTFLRTALQIEKVMISNERDQRKGFKWMVQLAIEALLQDEDINCIHCLDVRFEETLKELGFVQAEASGIYTLTKRGIEESQWPEKIAAQPILKSVTPLFS
jgi:hypothetical protein